MIYEFQGYCQQEQVEREGASLFPMRPKIVSWNVRWLNEANKHMQIKNLLHKWKANIVCLQETKLKKTNRKILRSLWSCAHMDWVYLASNGASGGVVVM